MGVCRARRAGRGRVRLGRRTNTGRAPDGEHLAGGIPVREPGRRRLRAHLAGRGVSANGYGLYDMIGNVWEWTTDWFSSRHPADEEMSCCIPIKPRGGSESDSIDQCSGARAHSAQGGEGRFASLRAQLLPALSAGRTPCATDRQRHEPCRLPLRGPGPGAVTDRS